MKTRIILFISAFAFAVIAAAQTNVQRYEQLMKAGKLDEAVATGIAIKNQLKAEKEYQQMFDMLRRIERDLQVYEQSSGKSVINYRYLVQKERLNVYVGWKKQTQSSEQFALLASIASKLKDAATLQDWLITKANYYTANGKADEVNQCYRDLLETRRQGKSVDEVGRQFEEVISLAEDNKHHSAATDISSLYRTWQDSVQSQRVAAQLLGVQQELDACQSTLSERESTITLGRAIIGALSIVVVGLAVGLIFFILLWTKGRITSRKLRKLLSFSNESNEQKSAFIQQISHRLMPQLQTIASNPSQSSAVMAQLQSFLHDVETYTHLEETRQERYELTEANVRSVCEKCLSVVRELVPSDILVDIDAPAVRFMTNSDVLTEIISYLCVSSSQIAGTTKIHIEFKKRGPHTGCFIVTNIGGILSEEEAQNLFVPFKDSGACPGDETGLGYPICMLKSIRLGGVLEIDAEYKKGTRFQLRVEE